MLLKLSLATLVGAVTLVASAAALAAKPAEPAPATEKPKLVCTSERTLGSHLPKRVCMTQSARDERSKRDQEAMRTLHDKTQRSPGG